MSNPAASDRYLAEIVDNFSPVTKTSMSLLCAVPYNAASRICDRLVDMGIIKTCGYLLPALRHPFRGRYYLIRRTEASVILLGREPRVHWGRIEKCMNLQGKARGFTLDEGLFIGAHRMAIPHVCAELGSAISDAAALPPYKPVEMIT